MKEFIVELDRPRRLKYGFRALRLIREHFGENWSLKQLADLEIDQLIVLLWAGLIWEDPNLTIEKVEELIDQKIPESYTIGNLTNLILEAMAEHIGIPRPEGSKKKTQTSSKKVVN